MPGAVFPLLMILISFFLSSMSIGLRARGIPTSIFWNPYRTKDLGSLNSREMGAGPSEKVPLHLKKPPPKLERRTVIVFDWDDTLFPLTHVLGSEWLAAGVLGLGFRVVGPRTCDLGLRVSRGCRLLGSLLCDMRLHRTSFHINRILGMT